MNYEDPRPTHRWVGAIIGALAIVAIGFAILAITQPLNSGEATVTPTPRQQTAPVAPTGQLDRYAPLACAPAEDSQPVDCETGDPLDYRDGGWYAPVAVPARSGSALPLLYTEAFQVCVRHEYNAWRADVDAYMAKYPDVDEAAEIARHGYPRTYEEALVHPRIGEVCGPEGSRR